MTVDKDRGVLVDGKPVNGPTPAATRPTREPSAPPRATFDNATTGGTTAGAPAPEPPAENPTAKPVPAVFLWIIGGMVIVLAIVILTRRKSDREAT